MVVKMQRARHLKLVPPPRVLPPLEQARDRPRLVLAKTKAPRRHRVAENWAVLVLIVLSCLFAGALAAYVLHPALNAITGR
jgi:hypothetical protein